MLSNLKSVFSNFIKNNNMLFSILLVAIAVLIALKLITPTTNVQPSSLLDTENTISTVGALNFEWRNVERSIEKDLANFLSKIDGCGKVEVLVRVARDESKIRAIDIDKTETTTEEKDNSGIIRSVKETRIIQETVQENVNGGTQTVWLEKQTPVIDGVIVIASGAHNAKIKSLLTKAVSIYFNIPVYKISILAGGF